MALPNTLPNTSQLTSQLARMPDAALKQMAMMHKNDPYTLPLIIAEDGRRKELRQASQAAMYQPQPKVVDKYIAAIGPLPEDVGIGTLSAPNIARMADGGIAGYSDGELIASNEPVLRMSGGGVVAFNGSGANLVSSFADWLGKMGTTLQEYAASPVETQTSLRDMYKSMMGASEAAPAAAAEAAPVAETAAKAGTEAAAATAEKGGIRGLLGKAMPWLGRAAGWGQVALHSGDLNANEADQLGKRDIYSAMYGMKDAPAPIKAALSDPDISKTDFIKRLNAWYASNPESASAIATKDAATTTAGSDKEKAPVVKPPVVRPPVATPPAAPAPTSGLSALAAAQKMPDIDPVAQAQAMGEKIYGTQETPLSIEERIARRDRFLGESPLKAQLERLAKQDDAAKKEKSDAASMALIKAGLSMMNPPRTAGGKFAGLLAGVGKGAGEGLEDYQVAMKELKAADREREKMRMDIERGQYAEKAGKWDNAEAAYEKAADRQTKMKDHIMQAASTGYGELIRGQLNLQQAQLTGEYGLKREEMQGLNALRAAQAQISAPGAQEKLFATLGNGDVLKGMKVYSDVMGAEAKGENALIAQYAKDPIALKMLEQTNPQLAQMIKMRMQQMLIPGVQTTPTAGGVRP